MSEEDTTDPIKNTSTAEPEWWATGYDEMDDLPEGDSGSRHYLKENQDATLLFLDGDPDDAQKFNRRYGAPFCIWESQIPTIDGDGKTNWRNWVTCVKGRKGPDGQPMRDFVRENAPDVKPYYLGFYTVMVIPEDVNWAKLLEKGDPFPESCRKTLLPAKRKLLKVLRRHAEKKGGLRGCIYVSYRSSNRAASTGDDWQFEEHLSEDEMAKLLPDGRDTPFEYHKLLAPQTEEEIVGLLKHRTKVSSFDDKDKKDDERGGGGERGRGRGRGRDSDQDSGRQSRRRGSTADDVQF